MTEETGDRIIMMNVSFFFVGAVVCLFFWVNSCQRTEIIKACLQYSDQKQECLK